MRVVAQRVTRASVRVDGEVVGAIGPGLALLVGFASGDAAGSIAWMADKVVGLRIFADARGRMERSLQDVGGEVLVVSQFTLYGDVRRGRRPSFVHAAASESARAHYDAFVAALEERLAAPVKTGRFGAMMTVALVNDGPVTLILEHPSASRADGRSGLGAQ